MAKKTTKKTTKRKPRVKEVAAAAPPAGLEPTAAPIAMGDVLGQSRAMAVLEDAMRTDRVHHAWVFHGPVGVGKFTAALAFAAALLDPSTAADLSGRFAPDPESPVQRLLASGTHPDLVVVKKELAVVSRDDRVRAGKQMTIAKEVLAEFLIEPAAKTRAVAGDSLAGKVFIVDEAELMAREGQNALLKTLEEPPPGTVVILVTSNEDRLLPTIRSRAQRVAFTPIGRAAMDAWLGGHDEFSAIDPSEREWLVAFADGSPGMFERAREAGFFAWHQTLEPKLNAVDAGRYVSDLGPTMHALVEERAQAVVKATPNASKDAANRAAAAQLFRLIGERYRRRLAEAVVGPVDADEPPMPLRAIDAVQQAQGMLDRNVSLQFVAESLSVSLASRG